MWSSQAVSIDGLYPTPAASEAAAALRGTRPRAFDGPTGGSTPWAAFTWQIALYGAIPGLMSLFIVGRHTRGDEEAGGPSCCGRPSSAGTRDHRRAAGDGRRRPGGRPRRDPALLPVAWGVAGSFALGAGVAGCGLVFGGVAAVTARLSGNTHAASGLAGALLGLAFVLRAAGDVGNGVLTWCRPWLAELVRPSPASAGGCSACSSPVRAGGGRGLRLTSRATSGAGLVAARPGPPGSPAVAASPGGLAWRLQRARSRRGPRPVRAGRGLRVGGQRPRGPGRRQRGVRDSSPPRRRQPDRRSGSRPPVLRRSPPGTR